MKRLTKQLNLKGSCHTDESNIQIDQPRVQQIERHDARDLIIT
jgi:hypothetical protein